MNAATETNRTASTLAVVSAVSVATGATYYLAGFETVSGGHVRASFTKLRAQAKTYSVKGIAAKVTKWSKDPYSSKNFTNFVSEPA